MKRRRLRRLEHLEEERENVRKWHAANKDWIREDNRRRYLENREQRLAYSKARNQRLAVENPAQLTAERQRVQRGARERQPWVALLKAAERRAKKRGIVFSLTREWAKSRWTGRCEMSGIAFDMSMPGTPGGRPFSPSIDRRDAALGYTKDNCQFVLWAINTMKSGGDNELVFKVAKAITDLKSIPGYTSDLES